MPTLFLYTAPQLETQENKWKYTLKYMQTPAKKLETDRVIAGAVEPLYQKQQQQQQLRKLALKKKWK